jgi:hypothetical protein
MLKISTALSVVTSSEHGAPSINGRQLLLPTGKPQQTGISHEGFWNHRHGTVLGADEGTDSDGRLVSLLNRLAIDDAGTE